MFCECKILFWQRWGVFIIMLCYYFVYKITKMNVFWMVMCALHALQGLLPVVFKQLIHLRIQMKQARRWNSESYWDLYELVWSWGRQLFFCGEEWRRQWSGRIRQGWAVSVWLEKFMAGGDFITITSCRAWMRAIWNESCESVWDKCRLW